MTESQRLQIQASEQRQRLNELSGLDTLNDDQRTELDGLTTAYADTERQTRAALLAEAAQGDKVEVHATPDSEDRERAALRAKATVSGFLMAAMAGRLPSGAEAAYSDACGVEPGKIPLDLFESDRPIEQHADATTPSPTTGTGTTVGRIAPYVFDQSIAARKLGIRMPTVPSGTWSEMALTTPPGTAAAKAKGDAIESTAGALSPVSTTARRISARLSLTAEDIAEVGTAKFEAAVRSALSGSLSDQYDIQCLRGDGQSPNVSGLMSQLDTPTAPTAVATFDSLLQAAAAYCGSKYAEEMSDVSILVPPDVYRLSVRLFRDAGQNHRGDVSAQKYLRGVLGGWSTATRLQNAPATGDRANISTGIVRRMGPGSDGAAVHPVWGHLSVDDIYSDSGSATRHVSLHVLVGAKLLLVREKGQIYDLVSFKVA